VSFAWIALVDGELEAWPAAAEPPVPGALRVDERVVDAAGDACEVSLVLTPPGVHIPMDDLAVLQARRRILAGRPYAAVSVLLAGDSRYEGSLVVARGDDVARLAEDPFARLFSARRLRVRAGVLGAVAAPAGPTIERYGSANPWPWDRF
jgi:hypothetical protein